jgi:chemotaxis protein MotB
VRKAVEETRIVAKVAEILGGTVDETGPGSGARNGPGGSQPPIPPPPDTLDDVQQHLIAELQAEVKGGQLEITLERRGLVISLRQAAFFPSGEDVIVSDTFSAIGKIANAINRLPNLIRLEGHTDPIPIRNSRFASNWQLSAARSLAMLELLTVRFNVDPKRLVIAGYADTIPMEENDTESGRARNRRVDIVVLSEDGVRVEPTSGVAASKPNIPPPNHQKES